MKSDISIESCRRQKVFKMIKLEISFRILYIIIPRTKVQYVSIFEWFSIFPVMTNQKNVKIFISTSNNFILSTVIEFLFLYNMKYFFNTCKHHKIIFFQKKKKKFFL